MKKSVRKCEKNKKMKKIKKISKKVLTNGIKSCIIGRLTREEQASRARHRSLKIEQQERLRALKSAKNLVKNTLKEKTQKVKRS